MTDQPGQIITFYSYKGGVGRSAALANVSALLAQQGKRVLAMDFDLEAPGLHRYFLARPDSGEVATATNGGVIDFFYALRSIFTAVLPSPSPEALLGQPELEQKLSEGIRSLLKPGLYTVDRCISDPNLGLESSGAITLMPAGKFDAGYAERVRKFPWQEFYESYPEFVELLVDELCAKFDFVLLDSRTGTTDVGNLCTVLLPEKLVLIFSMNEQSLNGAIEVGQQAVQLRKASPDLRPLPIFPLASRVENAEHDLQRSWLADAQSRFTDVFASSYGVKKDLSIYFDKIQIPHRSFYAYGEQVAAVRERTTESLSLAAAFARLVKALSSNNAVDAQARLQDSWGFQHDGAFAPGLQAPAPRAAAPKRGVEQPAFDTTPKVQPSTARTHLTWVLAAGAVAVLGVLLLSVRSNAPASPSAPTATVGAQTTPGSPGSASSFEWPSTASQAYPVTVPSLVTVVPMATAVATFRTKSTPPVPEASVSQPPELPLSPVIAHARSRLLPDEFNAQRKQLYQFRVWVEADDPSRIRAVSYFFNHPSFEQKSFMSTVGPTFEVGYKGWGCLKKVSVTVRWASGKTSAFNFDQCATK